MRLRDVRSEAMSRCGFVQLYTGAPSPSVSSTSACGSPWEPNPEPDAESPQVALALRDLLSQRPPGARQRLGFQTVDATASEAPQRPPSPIVGSSQVRAAGGPRIRHRN